MQSELECPVCLDLFKDPVIIPCAAAHSLCLACARGVYQNEEKCIRCPVCREIKPLADLANLQRNIVLRNVCDKYLSERIEKKEFSKSQRRIQIDELKRRNYLTTGGAKCMMCDKGSEKRAIVECLECKVKYCEDCVRLHPMRGKLAAHEMKDIDSTAEDGDGDGPPPQLVANCEFHPQYPRDLFCLECEVPVCAHCLLVGSHADHKRQPLSDAYESYTTRLQEHLLGLHNREEDLNDLTSRITHMRTKVGESSAVLVREVEIHFAKLEADLLRKKKELLESVIAREDERVCLLDEQKARCESIHAVVGKSVSRSTQLLQNAVHDPLAFLTDTPVMLRKTAEAAENWEVDSKVCVDHPQLDLTFYPLDLQCAIRTFDFEEERLRRVRFSEGMQVDASDHLGRWYEAVIVTKGEGSVRVHFEGLSDKWDEDIPIAAYTYRIAPRGTVTTDLPAHRRPSSARSTLSVTSIASASHTRTDSI